MKKILSFIFLILCVIIASSCAIPIHIPMFDEYAVLPRDMNPSFEYALSKDQAIDKLWDENYITSNILIESKSDQGFFGIIFGSTTKLGSGVIFYETELYYYALTNAHVVEGYQDRFHLLTITDFYNNVYRGFVYEGSYQESYDLAVVLFTKKAAELFVMEIKESDPLWHQPVIAVGNPHGNRNTVTIGEYLGREYQNILDENGEIIDRPYKFYTHNALIEPGSSGGMLLDFSMSLIGINTASTSNVDEFVKGYAIPGDFLIDYLEECIYVEISEE